MNSPSFWTVKMPKTRPWQSKNLVENTLIAYRSWADDIDQEAAKHWLHSPEVQADFKIAWVSFREVLKILWDAPE
nr:hypothetical protein GCM10020185_27830 [Pseudomonas brassicacearum subsp. brassicacearum]